MATTPKWQRRWYNGFSPEQRKALGDIAYRAMKRGALSRPETCHTCGRHRRDGIILGHLEDYRAWGDHFGMCLACHKALHERFRNPVLFRNWLRMLRAEERPVGFDNYNWARWNKLYRDTPADQWLTEPTEGPPNLALFTRVSLTYIDCVPPVFDRMNGAPLLNGQHRGEVGPLAQLIP